MTAHQLRLKLTKRIVKELKAGVPPWRQPWGAFNGLPSNFVSRRRYQGINTVFLMMATSSHQFTSKYWGTKSQWQKAGFQIKARRGTEIVFYRLAEIQVDGQLKKVPVIRAYQVFCLDQAIPATAKAEKKLTILQETGFFCNFAEQLLSHPDIDIRHGGDQASYNATSDYIALPLKTHFDNLSHYYNTAFHELVHRDLTHSAVELSYGMAELVAELGACYLAAEAGIPIHELLPTTESYLQVWLSAIHEDPNFLFKAARYASQCVDHLLTLAVSPLKEVG